jgi:hypothetical protein
VCGCVPVRADLKQACDSESRLELWESMGTVAERCVSARSNTEIVGSNPARGMDVCVVLCVGRGLPVG